VVDGRVKRDAEGKEVRYPVILTPQEKEMARKVVLAFKQRYVLFAFICLFYFCLVLLFYLFFVFIFLNNTNSTFCF
jgi:hypothetical protein